MINIIAAVSDNNVIGNKGDMPWNLPGDLARFKHLTKGSTVLKGRKTYQSVVSRLKDRTKEPLKGRNKVVLTHDPNFIAPYCEVVTDWTSILKRSSEGENIFILGGSEIYRLFLPHADNMFLTRVHATVEGDTFFPDWVTNEWGPYCDPYNMIAETDPRDQYKWSVSDYRRL